MRKRKRVDTRGNERVNGKLKNGREIKKQLKENDVCRKKNIENIEKIASKI